MSKLDANGHEMPDPQPVAIPAKFKRPETLAEQIRRVTRGILSDTAAAQGLESFDEANDFEIDDDSFDPTSPYEEVFDPVLGRAITPQEFKDNEAMYKERYERAQEQAWRAMDVSEALRARHPRAPDSKSGPKAVDKEPAPKPKSDGSSEVP